ncbi:hypothetical protein VTH82DRAFT_6136 [Thermothelomyces myriococcoides]
MGRPSGVVGRTQLKQDDLIRIQTLSRDARMGPSEIRRVTGYSIHQIKYALKKKTPTIGKRSGRPRKGEVAPRKQKAAEASAAGDGTATGNGQSGQLDPPVNQDENVATGEGNGQLSVELNNQAPGQVGQQEFGILDGQQQQQQQQQQHAPGQPHQQQQYQQFQQAQQPQPLRQQEQQQTQPDQYGQAFQPSQQ